MVTRCSSETPLLTMRRISVGGMSRGGKVAQPKKVSPPSVPEKATPGFRNSGSSFGSAGYASAGEDPPFLSDTKDGYESGECGVSCGPGGGSGKSPGASSFSSSFTFPTGQYMQVSGKAVYYHHQTLQEDQGIDMTQSPGRDSPGSSGSGSRHSTVSLDSGRASCHLSHHHRPSLSSSSVGSSDSSLPHRVDRLLLHGVPDQDILQTWLTDLHSEEYFPLFVNAGYDMHTISRMTPEDLTAIGIKKPNHRKKLKAEIAQLNISDGLPDYIPGSLSEWLRLLRLEEYGPALKAQGYHTVEDTAKIQVEDLEDVGIVKLGHQKRFLLAIKRLQDLKAGKTFPPTPFTPTTHVDLNQGANHADSLSAFRSFHQPWEFEHTSHTYHYTTDIVPIQIRGVRGKSLESLEGGECEPSGTTSFTGGGVGWCRYFEEGDVGASVAGTLFPQGGGTLPRQRPPLRPHLPPRTNSLLNHIQEGRKVVRGSAGSRLSTDCSSLTVVADLHLPRPPPHYASDQASFKSSSSTESDSLPFANENAGTIKQRAARNQLDYIPPIRVQSPPSDSSSNIPSRKTSKDSEDVLNDIGNMLANLTDELDAMLEEEKRQGLTDHD